jgi:hypothetical protein
MLFRTYILIFIFVLQKVYCQNVKVSIVFLYEREYQVIVDIKNYTEMLETGHSDIEKSNSKDTCFK